MKIPAPLQDRAKELAMTLADEVMARIPRARPPLATFQNARVIAHRGIHDDTCTENTIEAFDRALKLGVDGIEFDIRWTQDDEPVVHHDRDCLRTFGEAHVLEENPFEKLRGKFTRIPRLREVLERYGRKLHLMIELKKTGAGWSEKRLARLGEELSNLQSVQDYHLMSLDPCLLLRCEFASRSALLPVAEFNAERISETALQEKMGGLTAHYLLLKSELVKRHRDAGQSVGTGFIGSRSVLHRELGRGVDLIFTNDAAKILKLRPRRPSECSSE